ncbi:MAG TPA: urea ABC transporter ATP-binding subunit UrtE [bacterium]|nr:urea ABC transporter ATP-binding subunit UrtE [bacterium]
MLSIEGLNQYYGQSHTLWDVELQVPTGACVCLMGRNGVGKSTLLKALMGLVPIATGSITFDERPIQRLLPDARARLGIGYVPQGREIFPQLTVEENLRLGLAARQDRGTKIPDEVFELFPVLKKMLGRRGGDLSGGQQQQLAVGRALAGQPSLLVLDEPTEGIQPNIVSELGDIITRLNREGHYTVLLVEQKITFARRVAQQFCILDKGRSVAHGPMDGLTERLVDQHLRV